MQPAISQPTDRPTEASKQSQAASRRGAYCSCTGAEKPRSSDGTGFSLPATGSSKECSSWANGRARPGSMSRETKRTPTISERFGGVLGVLGGGGGGVGCSFLGRGWGGGGGFQGGGDILRQRQVGMQLLIHISRMALCRLFVVCSRETTCKARRTKSTSSNPTPGTTRLASRSSSTVSGTSSFPVAWSRSPSLEM